MRAAVTVTNQVVDVGAAAVVDRLLEGIEDEVRRQRRRHAPPDDGPGEDVDDERDVDEAGTIHSACVSGGDESPNKQFMNEISLEAAELFGGELRRASTGSSPAPVRRRACVAALGCDLRRILQCRDVRG